MAARQRAATTAMLTLNSRLNPVSKTAQLSMIAARGVIARAFLAAPLPGRWRRGRHVWSAAAATAADVRPGSDPVHQVAGGCNHVFKQANEKLKAMQAAMPHRSPTLHFSQVTVGGGCACVAFCRAASADSLTHTSGCVANFVTIIAFVYALPPSVAWESQQDSYRCTILLPPARA